MRESLDAEIADARANVPAEIAAAIRSALICVPMRDADRLRTGPGWVARARVTDAGNRWGRDVGKGEGAWDFFIVSPLTVNEEIHFGLKGTDLEALQIPGCVRPRFDDHAWHLIKKWHSSVPRWKVLGFPEGHCLEKPRETATTTGAAKVKPSFGSTHLPLGSRASWMTMYRSLEC